MNKMNEHRKQIIETIENLIQARDIIFNEIVSLSMSGEMNHLKNAFNVGDEYSFEFAHFEDVKDINVQKLVALCKNMEQTIFSLMSINRIDDNEVSL